MHVTNLAVRKRKNSHKLHAAAASIIVLGLMYLSTRYDPLRLELFRFDLNNGLCSKCLLLSPPGIIIPVGHKSVVVVVIVVHGGT